MKAHLILHLYFLPPCIRKKLQTAGMDADSLKQFVRLLERGADTREEQIRILRKFRFGLLEAIHGKQQELDQVDYLIHEIKEQGNPKGYLCAKW